MELINAFGTLNNSDNNTARIDHSEYYDQRLYYTIVACVAVNVFLCFTVLFGNFGDFGNTLDTFFTFAGEHFVGKSRCVRPCCWVSGSTSLYDNYFNVEYYISSQNL